MIDWLDFTIELRHPTIAQGRFMVIDEAGEVLRESDTFKKVEGSHDTTMQVMSTTSAPYYSQAMHELGLVPIHDTATHSSAISFYGNPVKYLQGHNVIGCNCLRSLVIAVIQDVFPKLCLPDSCFFDAISQAQNLNFWVSRIDLTNMYDLGSNENVEDYLYMMGLVVKARGDRCTYTRSTFYVGKHSTLWTAKFYNKYKELTSSSKKHYLNPEFSDTGLLEFSKGLLRAEITLRKTQLRRLNVLHASKLQPQLNNLYDEFIGRMTMTNQRADDIQLGSLSGVYHSTYTRWTAGENPKTFLKGKTFYNHRTKLLEIGVDISNPPIPQTERVAEIQPLQKTLAPKIVEWKDIPKSLMPHLVQPYKSPLRIA